MNRKNTGIIRKIDELGRVVIPIEIRNQLKIIEKDSIEIYIEGETIILKKFEANCIFCGNNKELVRYKEKNICKNCCEELNRTV